MGHAALAAAILGLGAIAVPGVGKYAAVGLGILAIGIGLVGYRRESARARARLAGAAGMAVGLLALALGATQVGLTLAALDRLVRMFSGS